MDTGGGERVRVMSLGGKTQLFDLVKYVRWNESNIDCLMRDDADVLLVNSVILPS